MSSLALTPSHLVPPPPSPNLLIFSPLSLHQQFGELRGYEGRKSEAFKARLMLRQGTKECAGNSMPASLDSPKEIYQAQASGLGHAPAVQPGSPALPGEAGRAGRREVRERLGPVRGAPISPTPAPRATPRLRRSPKTRMFLPDGSLDLARVDTSLRIEDLWGQQRSGQPRG